MMNGVYPLPPNGHAGGSTGHMTSPVSSQMTQHMPGTPMRAQDSLLQRRTTTIPVGMGQSLDRTPHHHAVNPYNYMPYYNPMYHNYLMMNPGTYAHMPPHHHQHMPTHGERDHSYHTDVHIEVTINISQFLSTLSIIKLKDFKVSKINIKIII